MLGQDLAGQEEDLERILPAYLFDELREQVKPGVQSNEEPSGEIEWQGSIVRTHSLLETYDEHDLSLLDPHLVYFLPTFLNISSSTCTFQEDVHVLAKSTLLYQETLCLYAKQLDYLKSDF